MMKKFLCALMVGLGVLALANGPVFAEEEGKEGGAVYELRTYTTHPGRLPALHKRFRDHTIKLFKKHGMTNVMYTTPVDKKNTLVYLLKHDSREAAKKSWAAFRKDPEWQKAYKESIEDGKIVMKVESVYLKTTDYSPSNSEK